MLKTQNKSEHDKENARNLIRAQALRLLGRREYSVWELHQKLQEKFPGEQNAIEGILVEFQTHNWISDQRYAAEFVREKSLYGGWGPMKIIQKLKEKGIAREIIESALEEGFSEEQQRKLAGRLAKEKWKLLYKKTAPQRRAAVQRFLVSRGFPFALVREATELLP